ncbi:MAG TPA: hypothetical protein VN231_09950, partial [Allosphingosinicella sp.]|nr:hypothetical protein [Allosphingosinicella sp.]
MPASISVTRLRSFLNDADGDNVADPLDTFSHTIIIANGAGEDALNVLDTETENGLTIDPGSVNIGPIAVDNTINGVVGNTPYNILASTL